MTETFPIVPGSARVLWVAVPLACVLAALAAVLALSLWGARHARFDVSPAGLRLRGDTYGRFVPAAELELAGARAVDLGAEPALQPVARTNGVGLPGYRAGWFRLRDGERALLYVTDASRVAYVPTRAGYAVLVSVADPAAFVASLRGTGRGGGDRSP